MSFISAMIVSNEETEKIKELFLSMDRTHDGFLSYDELVKGLGPVLGSFMSQG